MFSPGTATGQQLKLPCSHYDLPGRSSRTALAASPPAVGLHKRVEAARLKGLAAADRLQLDSPLGCWGILRTLQLGLRRDAGELAGWFHPSLAFQPFSDPPLFRCFGW